MSDQSPLPGTGTSQPGTGNLRFLRLLVTVLTGTMIAGLLVLIALLVIRFPSVTTPLPDAITLPDGTSAQAFTVTPGWYAVVTTDDRILIYNRSDGALRQEISIEDE
jgi:hypothetical protein